LPARTTSSPLPKSMRESSLAIYQIIATRTVPVTGTKSTGLAADASGVMVFANAT